MRISRIQLAGLAVALAGGAAQNAAADDLTISTATTTPVVTSNAANASAGDVTVATGGTITINTGQAAITVDSNNDVTNNGRIQATDQNNVVGIRLTNGFAGDVSGAGGSISFTENYTPTDLDNDGDADQPLASGTNRIAILLDPGVFTGNINYGGTITLEGNNSYGLRLNGRLDGNGVTTGNLTLSSASTITLTGANSSAVLIGGGAAGGVAGDVIVRAAGTIRGENSTAIHVAAPIDGELRVNGLWTTSGYRFQTRPSNVTNLDADDLLQNGAVLEVNFDVLGGVTIEGIGVEDDPDDDDDGTNGETDDNSRGNLASFGGAPALLVSADASSDLDLGPTAAPGGFGIHNRGVLQGSGEYDGVNAYGVRIVGILAGSQVTTAAGFMNDGTITAAGIEANATAVYVGANATVPMFLNRGSIGGNIVSEAAGDTAYGLFFDENANVSSLVNTGIIRAQISGELSGATAIFDTSDNLTSISNSGSIIALAVPTDPDPTDNIFPVATGPVRAIDLSTSTANVTINQVADAEPITPTPFTDDDAVDNDAASRPPVLIQGDILLGSGNDVFNLLAGSVLGDLEFGAGSDTLLINNGAIYRGALTDSGGNLSITVTNGVLDLRGGDINGEVNITGGLFDANSDLLVQLSSTPANSTLIQASGAVTFNAGASITPIIPSGLPLGDTIVFLTANNLFGGANVVNPNVVGDNVPYVYNLAIELTSPLAPDGAANGLQAVFGLKTAAQLGLSANQAAAFNPIIDALRLDADAAAAFTLLDSQAEFADAYEDLMPSFSSAAAELAATAIQQAQGASGNRLAATRLQGLDEVSVWAQEIGYAVSREPPSLNGQEFSGHGFGMAIGIDGPLDNGSLFGLSTSFITSEIEEEGRPDGEIAVTFGQVGAYLGTAIGAVDLDFVAGLGAGKLSSRRFVEIGEDYSALAEAEWWAYEGHGMARASVPMRMGNSFVITPQAALTYVFLSEEGYTEEGGGDAIDYEVDDTTSQRLWGDVGVELSARMRLRGDAVIAPRIFAGYRANIIDEEAERSFRFVSGAEQFTLTDDGYGDGGALIGIGFDATNGYSTFAIGYEGEFGDQIERHSLNASVRFRF